MGRPVSVRSPRRRAPTLERRCRPRVDPNRSGDGCEGASPRWVAASSPSVVTLQLRTTPGIFWAMIWAGPVYVPWLPLVLLQVTSMWSCACVICTVPIMMAFP